MKVVGEIDNINSRIRKDRVFLWLVVLFSALTVSPIILIISKLIEKGYKQLSFGFLIEKTPDTMQAMAAIANNELIPGGIVNGILGTVLMVVLASAFAIP
ncbi:MAG: phosphate ABC transporter, permease protein PstA, partial [Bacteroidota bacterium]|nr:phosphate ABC transporter, permease protein PstA [Bacteroidota bacterium]